MTTRLSPNVLNAFRRLIAVGGAALVLLLAVTAASPALHALAHAHATGHEQPATPGTDSADTCAVVLFAQGVAPITDTAVITLQTLVRHELQLPAAEEPLLAAARYLHQPERGPPAV